MTTAAAVHEAEAFGLAAEMISFPTERLATAISDGTLARIAGHLVEHLPYELGAAPAAFSPPVTFEALQSEYIRLFDAPDGRPCPLYTGVYAHRRHDAMEELLRFYRHFGLTVSPAAHDLPDSVPTVLEFVQFLCLREAQDSGDAGPLRLARADLISRHLYPWATNTMGRMAERSAAPFYAAAVGFVHDLARAETAYLREAAAVAS